jgi:DNA recombination protein RmuC
MFEHISLENIAGYTAQMDTVSIIVGAVCGLLMGLALLKQAKASLQSAMDRDVQALAEERKVSEALREELQERREAAIRLEAEKNAIAEKVEQHQQDIQKMEAQLVQRFENLSNKIFEEKSEKFKKLSQESLDQLLSPLKDKLSDFQKKVDESFGQQAKEQYSLKEQIEKIVLSNKEITQQAENLTNALKSDTKKQGNWGEIILEKILEDSGLRKGEDYILQGKDMGLKHPETGAAVKPDVVVKLPEGKHIVIDSKVSLTHYEQFVNAEDDGSRAGHLKKFIGGLKSQIGELEKRRYQDTDGLGTPDFVIMFLPIEGAYMAALTEDPDLQNHAWDKKVVMVCPSTLFATLRTIESVWRLERQNQNALEIARQGGGLYDKVAGFVGDMQKMGQQIQTVTKTYDAAMNKLSMGQGNILKRTEDLKVLGAKTSKSLPADLINEDKPSITATDDNRKTGTE